MLYRRLFPFLTIIYETDFFLDIQTLYSKYSFSSLGSGKAFTPFFVMCCKMAALQADCKLGTEKNFKILLSRIVATASKNRN